MQGIILKHDPEKGIKWYMEANFDVGWNHEYGKYPGSFLSIIRYVITYANCTVIWKSQLQIEIELNNTEE